MWIVTLNNPDLIGPYFLYQQHDYLGQLAAAMACGLQNAMVATYSGAVIRTTHLTGLTSDMGAAIGNWLAGRRISKPTLGFQAIIWYCFCAGGVVGAFLSKSAVKPRRSRAWM